MFPWSSSSSKSKDSSDSTSTKTPEQVASNLNNILSSPDTPPPALKPTNTSTTTATGSKSLLANFDPTGLERAAAAARELSSLPHAQEALSLAQAHEITRTNEAQAKAAAEITHQKQLDLQRVKVMEEERRKSFAAEREEKLRVLSQEDELRRRRFEYEEGRRIERVKMENHEREESAKRVEALRRQTAEYEGRVREKVEKARAEAEAEGKKRTERENWDLRVQKLKLKGEETRRTVLEGISRGVTEVGGGIKSFLTDQTRMTTAAMLITGIAVGVYGAKNAAKLTRVMLQRTLLQPPLVRETSAVNFYNLIRHPILSVKNWSNLRSLNSSSGQNTLGDIILENSLAQKLEQFVTATKNVRRNNAQYRNILLYGRPGTGKTLFAKQLARSVGMNYAVMTGSDVLPLGANAVTELHRLFDWAERSRKGLVLFVDEADAFLRKRSGFTSTDGKAAEVTGSGILSEENRNALNAFLYRTGSPSKKFMLVFATNQPNQLDFAVNDRTDELVHFPLPGKKERFEMLDMYFKHLISEEEKFNKGGLFNFGKSKKIELKLQDDELEMELRKIAEKLDDFSGREINKLVVAWQAAARSNANCELTKEGLWEIAEERIAQHKQRKKWESSNEDSNSK